MISFTEAQANIYALGAKIDAPIKNLKIYNFPQPDGTPYIQILDKYYYIIEERGCEFERRVTENEDQLYYWIMSDVVFSMASKFELDHRIDSKDNRRILFSRELQLMANLSQVWYEVKKNEIEATLRNSPFIE